MAPARERTVMLNVHVRPAINRVLTPVGTTLCRLGVSPDVVTVVGTVGVCVGALVFYPRGRFLAGTLFITAFVFSDMIDGAVARARGGSGPWGAFLDSTLDRVADAAIFGGLLLWFTGRGHSPALAAVTLFCLAAGFLVSYAKARAESLGLTCNVGLAERSERLLVVLCATGLDGFGLPYVQAVALWALGVATALTVAQRVLVVRRQAAPRTEPGRPPSRSASTAAVRQ